MRSHPSHQPALIRFRDEGLYLGLGFVPYHLQEPIRLTYKRPSVLGFRAHAPKPCRVSLPPTKASSAADQRDAETRASFSPCLFCQEPKGLLPRTITLSPFLRLCSLCASALSHTRPLPSVSSPLPSLHSPSTLPARTHVNRALFKSVRTCVYAHVCLHRGRAQGEKR